MNTANKEFYYPTATVRDQAKGRWLEILGYLADGYLSAAISRPGKHVACPRHSAGNQKGDGFRLFKDANETGGGICNTCGARHDGFEMLMWLFGWTFDETKNHVAEYLRIEAKPSKFSTASAQSSPVSSIKKDRPSISQERTVHSGVSNEPKVLPFSPPSLERMKEIRLIQERLAERVMLDAEKMAERISRTWAESIPLVHGVPGPVFRYLKARSILLRSEQLLKGDSIRFHPALPYYQDDEDDNIVLVGNFPAIVAAVRDQQRNIVTLHRTYLSPFGAKAAVESPRKMLSIPPNRTVSGCAIQLGGKPGDGVLGVAEGLETALSALRAYGAPVWSCLNATLLEQFTPPEGIKRVLIWADLDKSGRGQQAAHVLKARLEAMSIGAHILLPNKSMKEKGVDWNDVMVDEGIAGFPVWPLVRNIMYGARS